LKKLNDKGNVEGVKITKKHDNSNAAKTFRERAAEGKYKHCTNMNKKRLAEVITESHALTHVLCTHTTHT
jgi:hypothetical protein